MKPDEQTAVIAILLVSLFTGIFLFLVLPLPALAETDTDTVIFPGQTLVIPVPLCERSPMSIIVERGLLSEEEKRIALTFDTGCLQPRKIGLTDHLEWLSEPVLLLLQHLDDYGIKATFFPQGTWLQDYPRVGREIVRRGHSIGNHTLTHVHFQEITLEEAASEVRQATRVIEETTGIHPYIFRPSFGYFTEYNSRVFAREGYPYIALWTVITQDTYPYDIWGNPMSSGYILWRALNYADDGGIILMHSIPKTVQALPALIKALESKDYTFVTIDEMLPQTPAELGPVIYTVREGDCLTGVAEMFGITVEEIITANLTDKHHRSLFSPNVLTFYRLYPRR